MRELGIPVKSVNWARVFAGQRKNGEPLLLMVAGQDAGGLFVCDIHCDSGRCTQYSVGLQNANFPTATCFNPGTGVLYLGSAYTGHLHRFDPNPPEGQRVLEDLGPIDPGTSRFPCAIDEAPDGSIYIGAFPACALTRFDPPTRTFIRFGRMAENEMYFYSACGADGTVAGLAKTREPHVVCLDPVTGQHHDVGPRVSTEAGEKIELRKGPGGLLYIVSSKGDFRLENGAAIPVEEAPAPLPPSTLPDGSAVDWLDGHRTGYRSLQVASPAGKTHTLSLDWQGGGTGIFWVHAGPNDQIYGSSILPEHLFTCAPDGSALKDLGACSEAIGEAYSMANFEGKIYIASYPQARLSIYDPQEPYHFGTDENSNPRDIGRLDEVAYRPRAMLAGPAGKIWIGSYPDYGLLGGTLAWHDPVSGESRSHRHIAQDCSVTALEWLSDSDEILVGTSVIGGNGTKPAATRAPFLLWDPHRDEPLWTGDFGLQVNDSIIDIKAWRGGLVYAVVVHCIDATDEARPLEAELVLIDVAARQVLDRSPFPLPDWPLELSLRAGPGGALYGCCSASFYRVTPGTTQREVLWSIPYEQAEDHIHAPGALIGGTYYCGSGYRLRALDFANAIPATKPLTVIGISPR